MKLMTMFSTVMRLFAQHRNLEVEKDPIEILNLGVQLAKSNCSDSDLRRIRSRLRSDEDMTQKWMDEFIVKHRESPNGLSAVSLALFFRRMANESPEQKTLAQYALQDAVGKRFDIDWDAFRKAENQDDDEEDSEQSSGTLTL